MKVKLLSIIAIFLSLQGFAQLQYKWASNPANSWVAADIKTGPNGEVYYLERSSTGFPDYTTLRRLNTATGTAAWTVTSQGPGAAYPECMAVDNAGNIYISGEFSDTIRLNPSNLSQYLYSASGTDIFVAKYDANGNYLWGIQTTTQPNSYIGCYAIETDNANNVIVAGYYYGSADFDPGANNSNTVSGNSGSDQEIFVAKYDSDGNYTWLKHPGSGSGDTKASALVADDANNIYVGGSYANTIDFGNGPLTAVNTNGFLVKYDASGTSLWSKALESTNTISINSMQTNATGNLYIAGTFKGQVDMDATSATLTSAGNFDMFIAKYSPTGIYVWAKGIGSTGSDYATAIVLDNRDGLFFTGDFNGTVDFDAAGGTSNITANGNSADVYIARYDTAGNYTYVRHMTGGPDLDIGYGLAVSGDSSLYLAGTFASGLNVNLEGGSNFLTNFGTENAFYVKYRIRSNATDLLTFTLPEQVAPATIDHVDHMVNITVNASANLAALTPTITVSPGARLTPNSNTTQDFSAPFTYLVESEDSSALQGWMVMVTKLTGVDEELAQQVHIYPNPANGMVTINTGKLANTVVELFDITGRTILSQRLNNSTTQLNIAHLNSGLYFYKLWYKGELLKTEKLVVN